MKDLLKKNIPFIVLFIVILLCVVMRDASFSIPVVSNPDSQIIFSTNQTVLEQTWQPPVKNISGVRIPYTSMADFSGNMAFLIYSDDYSEILAQADIQCVFRAGEEGILEPDFPKIKVIPGERYRICLRYEDVLEEGALQFASGSQYAGCTIDGTDFNAAAAFEIISVKPSLWIQLLAVFGSFAAFSLLFMILWERKWEECIGLSMFGIAALLYVAGLFDKLPAGMALVYVLAGVSLPVSIYFYHKKKLSAGNLYSPALIVYGVICLLIALNCKGAWFARWDEYSHWGLAVKDMFYYDSFAKHVNTTVTLPRYVPFATLIEYFFVFANGLFSQELVYIAYQTAMLNALIVVCGAARKRKSCLIPAIAIMVLLPALFFYDIYNSIYVDSMLAVFAAYVLICYYTEELKGFNLLRILGCLFAMTLTKDMGMVIAGLLTAVMAADRLYQSIRQKKKAVRSLLCPCACALFVVGVYMSWQIYMSIPMKEPENRTAAAVKEEENIPMLAGIYEETASIDGAAPGALSGGEDDSSYDGEGPADAAFQSTASASGITIDGILGLLRHEDGGYRYQAIKNYLIKIFDGETFWLGSVSVSYVDMYILLLLLTGGLWLAGFWGSWADKMASFGVFTFLTGICYTLVLELLYLFAFPMGEALQLVSHGRYFGSFMGGVVIAFASLLILRTLEKEAENKRLNLAVISGLTAGIIICTPMQNFVVKNMDTQIKEENLYGSREIEEAFRSISARTEKIYFVCNGGGGSTYLIFKNLVSPVLTPYQEYDIYGSEAAYVRQNEIRAGRGEENSEKGIILPCDALEDRLDDAQYLFLFHPGEVFQESYGSLFEEDDTIEDGAYYRVERTADGIRMKFIGKIDVGVYR
ncbi:MAG: hypothetical protein NC341_04735 [Blautia sp.]|nr:hypothetical protein [Blautia sp.]MCM1200942.1 hypothetical protein [Bacteroides fragilis]